MTIVNNGEEFTSFSIKFYTAPTHYMISTGDFENVFAYLYFLCSKNRINLEKILLIQGRRKV